MVWGMTLPRNFGEFWPAGEFTGWAGDLVKHYMAQSPETQRALYDGHPDPVECAVSYPLYVSRKFTNEAGSRMSPGPEDPPFSPIKQHEAPKVFAAERMYEELGSLIMCNDRIIAVDDALKDVIDRFEPGMHEFFPVEIAMPKGKVFPKAFHILAIGQYLDSFVLDHSDPDAFEEIPNSNGKLQMPSYPGPAETIPGLALSRNVSGRAHLWRERRFGEWLTCFSDELVAEIDLKGLRIPGYYRMKEV